MITKFKTKLENVNGLKVLEIKYLDNSNLDYWKAYHLIQKFVKKGWVVDCNYKNNYTDEYIIIMSKV
tara:strand:- start:201 stop:401 length:201 start_codon:yes stop_codon:yes gene_type:complete